MIVMYIIMYIVQKYVLCYSHEQATFLETLLIVIIDNQSQYSARAAIPKMGVWSCKSGRGSAKIRARFTCGLQPPPPPPPLLKSYLHPCSMATKLSQ